MLGIHTGRLTAPGLVTRGRAWLRCRVRALGGLRKTAAAVAAGAPIRPGERVLTGVRQANEALVVATAHAVYHQDGPGGSWSRLGWEDVDQVLWDEERRAVTLTPVRSAGSSPVVFCLPGSVPLVDFARERVTSTTLARAPLLSGGRVCGWLTARRPPGSDQVSWTIWVRDDAAFGDPALGSRVAGAIAALEADLGIEAWRATGTHEWRPGPGS